MNDFNQLPNVDCVIPVLFSVVKTLTVKVVGLCSSESIKKHRSDFK